MTLHSPRIRVGIAGTALAALALAVAGCGSSSSTKSTSGASTSAATSGNGPMVALLLPENQTARYETHDKPDFQAKLTQACPTCKLLYSNATQDATKQQSQADAALTQGAKVLVLDPVDAGSAVAIVAKAKARNVPVISYDRLINNADITYYVSFDNAGVGKLQATALDAKLKTLGKATGPIIMINGDPADNNAKLFKQGAMGQFKTDGVKIAKQYDTPGWLGSNAQNEAQQAITALGNGGFAAIYGANDDMAEGGIAAMKSAGIDPKTRPTTGQDASLAGVQRILDGTQFMTVYKAVTTEAQDTAQLAGALAQGQQPPAGLVNQQTNNGMKSVPSVILTPVAVTSTNIKDTVVKDNFWKVSDICTSAYAAACKKAGIQ
ncbi:MAG: D-xylose transport system substrate-binding protein [Solirubrobacteraceae bacterium]|nr:D-xylose transport system substrate-binding protein [Solirubrobacteraceae bacterium]